MATATISLYLKEETSITVRWESNANFDRASYTLDNGKNWSSRDFTESSEGILTFNDRFPNTSYDIKLKLSRRDGTISPCETNVLTVTTYDYPHIETVNSPNLAIGDQQTLTLYNPLERNVIVAMYKTSLYGDKLVSYDTNSDSITISPPADVLYESIPNNQSSGCVYSVTYSGIERETDNKYRYSVKGTEAPTFTDFTYKITNSSVNNVTGNDQVIVGKVSSIKVTVSAENKMITHNFATPDYYTVNIGNLSEKIFYSDNSDASVGFDLTVNEGQKLSVSAVDSRGLSTTVSKDITMYAYEKPEIFATVSRLNVFENETTLKVNGTYTQMQINGENKNTITKVQYRYKERDSNNWSGWIDFKTTVLNGKFNCDDVILSLDNTKAFSFEVQAVDRFNEVSTKLLSVDVGNPIFLISTNKRACYINNRKVVTTDDLNNKVDKVEGKGLSSEDFTVEDKEKLDNAVLTTEVVQEIGMSTTNIMSQKAVTDKLNEKMDINQEYIRRRQYVPLTSSAGNIGWLLVLHGENNLQHENYSCMLAVTQTFPATSNQSSGIIFFNIRVNDYNMFVADFRIVCGNLLPDRFRLVINSYTDFYIYIKTTAGFERYMFEVLSEGRQTGSTYLPTFEFNSTTTSTSTDPGGTKPKSNEQVILDLVYPVGAIYMSVNSTNPQNLFGGTWVSWGTGRVPVGINTSDGDFNTVEKTGGEKSVLLNNNTRGSYTCNNEAADTGLVASSIFQGRVMVNCNCKAHNNLQPYITCYMWKRTG